MGAHGIVLRTLHYEKNVIYSFQQGNSVAGYMACSQKVQLCYKDDIFILHLVPMRAPASSNNCEHWCSSCYYLHVCIASSFIYHTKKGTALMCQRLLIIYFKLRKISSNEDFGILRNYINGTNVNILM